MSSRHVRVAACEISRGVLLGALVWFCALPAAAQTVRPVVVEYKGKASGRFEVVNNTVFPLNVILEPKSFSVSLEGKPVFRPLDDGIDLKLSSMSFRIPAGQSRYVFYRATAEVFPAWFVIYCSLRGMRTREGMNVAVELPHTVYLLQKKPLEESDIRLSPVEFRPEEGQVVAELENPSDRLGRVMELRVSSSPNGKSYGGFPVMPESRRRLILDWDREVEPRKISIRFKRFTLKKEVQVSAK